MGMMSPAQASVAQLDRVLPSEGRGRGFESRRVHQIQMKKPQVERPGAFLHFGFDRSHALRGSVTGSIPTQSVGTIIAGLTRL